MPILSIIIPHHEEDEKRIRPLWESINRQVGVHPGEVEIIAVDNTGSYKDCYSFINTLENIDCSGRGGGNL